MYVYNEVLIKFWQENKVKETGEGRVSFTINCLTYLRTADKFNRHKMIKRHQLLSTLACRFKVKSFVIAKVQNTYP